MLSKSDERPKPVSQPAPHLVLGDGHSESSALGNTRVASVLACPPEGGNGACLITRTACSHGSSVCMPERRLPSDSFINLLCLCGYIGYSLKAGLYQWSKACYTYGVAALLLQLGGDDNKIEAMR